MPPSHLLLLQGKFTSMYKQNMVVADISASVEIFPGYSTTVNTKTTFDLSLDGSEMIVPYGSLQILGSPVLILPDKWNCRLEILNPNKPVDVKSLLTFSVDEKVIKINPGDFIGYVVKINPFFPIKEES